MKFKSTALNIIRVVLLATAFGWASLHAAQVRTMHPGIQIQSVFFEFAFALVPALLLGSPGMIGFSWSAKARVIGLMALFSVFCAELWAGLEEIRFVQQHQTVASGPKARAYFSSCWLAYDPATKTLSGAD